MARMLNATPSAAPVNIIEPKITISARPYAGRGESNIPHSQPAVAPIANEPKSKSTEIQPSEICN